MIAPNLGALSECVPACASEAFVFLVIQIRDEHKEAPKKNTNMHVGQNWGIYARWDFRHDGNNSTTHRCRMFLQGKKSTRVSVAHLHRNERKSLGVLLPWIADWCRSVAPRDTRSSFDNSLHCDALRERLRLVPRLPRAAAVAAAACRVAFTRIFTVANNFI